MECGSAYDAGGTRPILSSPLPKFCSSTANPRTRLWLRPNGWATLSDYALRSCRAGESCNFKPRTATPESSPQWRPILPAWPWVAWLPRCAQSRNSAPVGLLPPPRGRRSARSQSATRTDMAVHARGGGGRGGVSSDLRCPTPGSGGAHIRQRGCRSRSSPQLGAITAQTSSCSHSARRCSPALSARWRFGTS